MNEVFFPHILPPSHNEMKKNQIEKIKNWPMFFMVEINYLSIFIEEQTIRNREKLIKWNYYMKTVHFTRIAVYALSSGFIFLLSSWNNIKLRMRFVIIEYTGILILGAHVITTVHDVTRNKAILSDSYNAIILRKNITLNYN